MSTSRRNFGIAMCAAAGTGLAARFFTSFTGRPETDEREHLRHNEVPVAVSPNPGLEDLVSLDSVVHLLKSLAPCWDTVKVSRVLHALRLWGSNVEFSEGGFQRLSTGRLFSGADLLQFFLDHEFYAEAAPGGPHLFAPTGSGWCAVYSSPIASDFTGQLSHQDDFLRICCDLALPLSTKVSTVYGDFALSELLQGSLNRFEMVQELEWSAETIARCLAPINSWQNSAGDTFDLDMVAERLVARTIGQGSCLGTHVEYALAVLLQLNDRFSILSAAVAEKIHQRLKRIGDLLNASFDGWNGLWRPTPTIPGPNDDAPITEVAVRLLATGHHLEWLAMAPADVRPDSSIIEDAAIRALDDAGRLSPYQIQEAYLALSHLARALCLMKGRTPLEVIQG